MTLSSMLKEKEKKLIKICHSQVQSTTSKEDLFRLNGIYMQSKLLMISTQNWRQERAKSQKVLYEKYAGKIFVYARCLELVTAIFYQIFIFSPNDNP